MYKIIYTSTWFRGVDLWIDISSALILALIASFAFRYYKLGKKKNYLYYLKKGTIYCIKMARGGKSSGKPQAVAKTGVKHESGYLYFIDKKGNVFKAKMSRGGKAKRKAKKSRSKRR